MLNRQFASGTKSSLPIDKIKDGKDIPCMTAQSTLTGKNQTTLPKAVVEALGIKPGDKLIYEREDGGFILRARTGKIADLAGRYAGFGKHPRRPVSIGEMNGAAAVSYAAHGSRGLRHAARP